MKDCTTWSQPHLNDRELLAEGKRLTECERAATAQLIAALAELDDRRLYLGAGCSSLFTYCTQVLYLSEHAAYGRIEAARAARRFPVILALLARGDITLTAVGLLAPHLTSQNHAALLQEAHHKSKRYVERMVACLRPQPPVPAMVRRLPSPRPTAMPDVEALAKSPDGRAIPPPMAPAPSALARAVVAPLAPHRYKLQLTIGQETHDKLRRVQDLLRHSIPTGDPAAILDRALTLLLAELERSKCAATERPRRVLDVRKRSRHVPATVKRAVWSRDKGQCAFVGTNGRCPERGFLEFHHVQPHAAGGDATVANIELRCRAHNNYEKDVFFGVLPSNGKNKSAVLFQSARCAHAS